MAKKNKGMMFILSSPSGVGKTTLTKKIAKNNHNFIISVSHTTRKPRPNEVNGNDYFFVSVEGYYNKKIQSLKLFKSQNNKSYFQKRTLESFHSNFQCSKKGLSLVEQFKIIELFGGR